MIPLNEFMSSTVDPYACSQVCSSHSPFQMTTLPRSRTSQRSILVMMMTSMMSMCRWGVRVREVVVGVLGIVERHGRERGHCVLISRMSCGLRLVCEVSAGMIVIMSRRRRRRPMIMRAVTVRAVRMLMGPVADHSDAAWSVLGRGVLRGRLGCHLGDGAAGFCRSDCLCSLEIFEFLRVGGRQMPPRVVERVLAVVEVLVVVEVLAVVEVVELAVVVVLADVMMLGVMVLAEVVLVMVLDVVVLAVELVVLVVHAIPELLLAMLNVTAAVMVVVVVVVVVVVELSLSQRSRLSLLHGQQLPLAHQRLAPLVVPPVAVPAGAI